MAPNIVILTGSGVSAESGLLTFRDAGGLWENHDVMDVASIEGWHRNPQLVLEFYNQRRLQAYGAQPNAGHDAIAEMQRRYGAKVITQNVDGLHEKAGCSQVLHLHGELSKVRSTADDGYVVDIADGRIDLGDVCPTGGQLRPHVVWFGEMVPLIETAAEWCASADILIVAGTSLEVYPAAGLVHQIPSHAEVYVVDPHSPSMISRNLVRFVREKGTVGLPALLDELALRFG